MKLKLTFAYVLALGMMFLTANSLFSQTSGTPKTSSTKKANYPPQVEKAAIEQIEALLRLKMVNEFITTAYEKKMDPKEVNTHLKNLNGFYSKPVNPAADSKNSTLAESFDFIQKRKSAQKDFVASIFGSGGKIEKRNYETMKNNAPLFDKRIDEISKYVSSTTVEKIEANLNFEF
jgi:hypothetical protein